MDASNFQKKAAGRLNLCFDMFEFGVDMMKQKIRREAPEATDGEIQAQLRSWLHERPGAEHGDALGHRASWAQRQR